MPKLSAFYLCAHVGKNSLFLACKSELNLRLELHFTLFHFRTCNVLLVSCTIRCFYFFLYRIIVWCNMWYANLLPLFVCKLSEFIFNFNLNNRNWNNCALVLVSSNKKRSSQLAATYRCICKLFNTRMGYCQW